MNLELDSYLNEKADIILLSGFLGAGKTTLLKRILSWEDDLSDTVILVNEFGDIGIDGDLLKDSGSDVIELASGCICCTLSADLRIALADIWECFSPKRIFIESSGLADPVAVASALKDTGIDQYMRLEKIITVLDADFWEAREAFGRLFYSQLETAHLILLNKIDMQAKDKIAQFLKEIHEAIPGSQVVPAIRCNIDPETLWTTAKPEKTHELKPIRFFNAVSLNGETDTQKHHHSDASNYVTFSFRDNRTIDETKFKAFMEQLPWELFRVKGPVKFQDRTVMVNFVGGKNEYTDWDNTQETRLAFIGWDIDGDEILQKLKHCIIQP